MTEAEGHKGLFELLQEMEPDLAAQIDEDAKAKGLSPTEVEARLKAEVERLRLRERVEKDLKARGISLDDEDDLDELVDEIQMLPILLQRFSSLYENPRAKTLSAEESKEELSKRGLSSRAPGKHTETISTEELERRLGWQGTLTEDPEGPAGTISIDELTSRLRERGILPKGKKSENETPE